MHAVLLLFFQNYDLLIDFDVFLCFFEDFCVYLHFLGSKGPGPTGPGPKGPGPKGPGPKGPGPKGIFCISRLLYFINWGGLLTEGGSY